MTNGTHHSAGLRWRPIRPGYARPTLCHGACRQPLLAARAGGFTPVFGRQCPRWGLHSGSCPSVGPSGYEAGMGPLKTAAAPGPEGPNGEAQRGDP
eukprot:CAMPEP_0204363684 /NCGR_PEP_ID=MMETSP0469-20131031/40559_1 /ASSEMBLY_ACC=CAM_ASM_000384 /TAXON_ID=2969 /ORGANISM="Oxyrrhis marina" /LENGTH=95 /DNA_ID=CAMNT_0051352465 /DNA_START=9 /DNA_END=296 /DNA_ORIENTATION=+